MTAAGSSRDLRVRLAAALSAPGAGLLLDLDGTLVLSEELHRRAYRRYFATRGWAVDDDVLARFSGRRADEVFPTLDGPWRGEDPVALTTAVLAALAAMVADGERPAEVPGARRALAAAAGAGIPTAVVTSARREWTAGVLDALGPTAGVRLVTAEDCACGKPDPEPYRRGAGVLALPPGGLVAFEDAPAGVASARAAGVGLVVGVTTSLPAAALLAAGADACSPDLRSLAATLEAVGTTATPGSGAPPAEVPPQPPPSGRHRPL